MSFLVMAAISGGLIGLGVWLVLAGCGLPSSFSPTRLRQTTSGQAGSGRARRHRARPGQSSSGRQLFSPFRAGQTGFGAAGSLRVGTLVIAVIMAALAYAVTQWVMLAALVGVSIVLFWGRLSPGKQTASLADRGDCIASWIETLYGTIAAGGGFEKAIAVSARSAPEAIREPVESLAARLEVTPLPLAMRDFARDMAHPACDKVATALTLASVKGAQNIVGLLRAQAVSVRQESQLLRSQQAGRVKFLTSARIVIGATLAVAVGIYLFDDGYLEPYNSAFGQLMLAVVGAGFMGGYALLVKMGRAAPPPRYFEMAEAEDEAGAAVSAVSGTVSGGTAGTAVGGIAGAIAGVAAGPAGGAGRGLLA